VFGFFKKQVRIPQHPFAEQCLIYAQLCLVQASPFSSPSTAALNATASIGVLLKAETLPDIIAFARQEYPDATHPELCQAIADNVLPALAGMIRKEAPRAELDRVTKAVHRMLFLLAAELLAEATPAPVAAPVTHARKESDMACNQPGGSNYDNWRERGAALNAYVKQRNERATRMAAAPPAPVKRVL
jgi:hypothetical protein